MTTPTSAAQLRASAALEAAFDEATYLRENPDVAAAVARGDIESALKHYLAHGIREGRTPPPSPSEPRQRLIRTAPGGTIQTVQAFDQFFESVLVSRGGGVMVIGWIDDETDPIECVRVFGPGWRVTFDGEALARIRRPDVETALATMASHPYGYYGIIFAGEPVDVGADCQIEIRLTESGRTASTTSAPRLFDDIQFRDTALAYVAAAHHFGNPHVKAIAGFDRGAGAEIIKLNQSITHELIAQPYVERFGAAGGAYDGSLVVCLYGKPEFLFLQAALYGAVRGMRRYELIFVSNSPEMAETLLREAKIVQDIYGLDITVVILAGNAGFGAANNVGVAHARSNRILIINPDVFPMDLDWAERHSAILAQAPPQQTRLFGAPLYYDDGSLMHGGMYFELDTGLAFEGGRHRVCQLIRVEHYGKGAPPDLACFTEPRPVPAVTGAFISCERGWFERLGGFTEDYVFGHYEDADLCLKSLAAGSPAWMQDLRMWHLEGKGSTRLPVHEGGSLVNRWLFSSHWGATITANLIGQIPAHPALQTAAATHYPANRATVEPFVAVGSLNRGSKP